MIPKQRLDEILKGGKFTYGEGMDMAIELSELRAIVENNYSRADIGGHGRWCMYCGNNNVPYVQENHAPDCIVNRYSEYKEKK